MGSDASSRKMIGLRTGETESIFSEALRDFPGVDQAED